MENNIIRSEYGANCKFYRNTSIIDCRFGDFVTIGDDSSIVSSIFGNHIAINRRSYCNNSTIGDGSYTGINTTINYSKIGKYCSIARNVDIGGFNHDYTRISTMPLFRYNQLFNNIMPHDTDNINNDFCIIENDVWIAAGAHILHNVSVGNGAVIGAGAVITKDVKPYSIVVGVPGKELKMRFDSDIIKNLLDIKWWDWPESVIKDNLQLLISADVTDSLIQKLYDIKSEIVKC